MCKRLASTREGTRVIVPSKLSPLVKSSTAKDDIIPSDTEAGLQYMQQLSSIDEYSLPPLVLKHQIYSIIKDKTTVDKELMLMRNDGKIRLIKLESSGDDYIIISTNHYHKLVIDQLGTTHLSQKVISCLIPNCVDVSVTLTQLTIDLSFTNDQISTLVKHGLLLVRDVGRHSSWWFTIPGVSIYKTDIIKGRKLVKQMFKRVINNEILQKDLEIKKVPCSSFPMEYYIHDLIGSEIVESVNTSSGPLLKLIH